MLEKCLKCNTTFEVDESLITSKLKFFFKLKIITKIYSLAE